MYMRVECAVRVCVCLGSEGGEVGKEFVCVCITYIYSARLSVCVRLSVGLGKRVW